MLKNDTALIVDRTPDVRHYIASILQRQLGCRRIFQAASYDETRQLLQTGTDQPNWIFFDWDVPGEDPRDLLRTIQRQLGAQHAHVLIMTRQPKKSVLDDMLRAGGTDYLIKPFTLSILLFKVRRLASLQERRPQERIQPPPSQEVRVEFAPARQAEGTLLNISSSGCLIRMPVAHCTLAQIYMTSRLVLQSSDGEIALNGELVRLEADHAPDPATKHILLAFQFVDVSSEPRRQLQRFVAGFNPPLPKGWDGSLSR